MKDLQKAVLGLKFLKPRSVDILLRRMNHETLEDVGEYYKMTRERVRQVQKESLLDIYSRGFESLSMDIITRITAKPQSKGSAEEQRREVRRNLLSILESGFDNKRLAEAMSISRKVEDLELCKIMRSVYNICWYGKYIHCTICAQPKHIDEFGPGIRKAVAAGRKIQRSCRSCWRVRQNKYYHSHKEECKAYAHPNRLYLYMIRSKMKRDGFQHLMPPLPPPDIRGEIPHVNLKAVEQMGGWDKFWEYTRKWQRQQRKSIGKAGSR